VKTNPLLLLRISLGLLMFIWGVDKLVNVKHGLEASRYFYFGAFDSAVLLQALKSVVDPWAWYLEGANVLFSPSLIIFAASLVLWTFRYEDRLVVGRRARAR
jgi:hypothetical protein